MEKTFSLVRKVNLGKLGFSYETVDFGVQGCATKEEATKEVELWIREYIVDLKEKQIIKQEEEEKKMLEQFNSKLPLGNKSALAK